VLVIVNAINHGAVGNHADVSCARH
jgi:hypothetical protein